MNKEQIERIEEMEKCLDEASKAIKELSDALINYEWARERYYKVQEYYDSELWLLERMEKATLYESTGEETV